MKFNYDTASKIEIIWIVYCGQMGDITGDINVYFARELVYCDV